MSWKGNHLKGKCWSCNKVRQIRYVYGQHICWSCYRDLLADKRKGKGK